MENSLKHGCTPGNGALHLLLEARREADWLTLVFSDDGAAGNGAPGLGLGLGNLEQRLKRFAGSTAAMDAVPRPEGGFAVTMRWCSRSKAAA